MLLMLKSVLKQRVNIQFCILNESSANLPLSRYGRVARHPPATRLCSFLLKVVAEVIDPVMGSFQFGCIKRQVRTIEATHIRMMNLLLVIYPPVGRLQTRDISRQTKDKIVGWNYSLRIIFPHDCIHLRARKYCVDRKNQHVNVFQIMIERGIRHSAIVAPDSDPQTPGLNNLNRIIEPDYIVWRTTPLLGICGAGI